MVVGILDYDMLLEPRHYMLNLDVMQISSYYKRQNAKVVLCSTTNLSRMNWFDIIYLIYNGEKKIDTEKLITDDRIVLVGTYFWGTYLNLPQEIMDSYPDRTIYDGVLNSNRFSAKRLMMLKNLYRVADFLRYKIPSNKNFITSTSVKLIFYDHNITAADYNNLASFGKKFLCYYDINISSLKEAEHWLENKPYLHGWNNKCQFLGRLTEKDLMTLLEDDRESFRRAFKVSFGNCEPQYYNAEAKKFIRFGRREKELNRKLKIQVAEITDKNYRFLFDCIKQWCNSKRDLNDDIFHTYFTKLEHFKFGQKIKATDRELYTLLTSTLQRRYEDEQAGKDYWRLDSKPTKTSFPEL